MNRIWLFRMIAILMILGFFLIFAHMQRRLVELQRTRPAVPATST